MSSVLDFRISASYGTTEVLHEVAATIAPGEIVSLGGLSGSGKSTLALALLRLLRYRGGVVTGNIRLEGTELTTLSESGMRAIRGRRIGYVPQSPGLSLNPRLRVETLLDETWRAHASRSANHRVLLESVQLPADAAFLRKRADELSTGQGQRLLIALALMHDPACFWPMSLPARSTRSRRRAFYNCLAGSTASEAPRYSSSRMTCCRSRESAIGSTFSTKAVWSNPAHPQLSSEPLNIPSRASLCLQCSALLYRTELYGAELYRTELYRTD